MNILFVCKYNRFRSKVAEAFFNKYNKNKLNFAKSAGLIKGSYPLDSLQVKVADEIGIKLKGNPQGLSTELLKWSDLYVIVADDVPSDIFKAEEYGKKIEKWNIKDVEFDDENENKSIILQIENKIKDFIRSNN